MEKLNNARQRLFRKLRQVIRYERVLRAMEQMPRQAFVPENLRHLSYDDAPLPIGEGQTISQPTIVAIMTGALELRDKDRVLEVGTGSGYQSAILSLLASEGWVVSVERVPWLAEKAASILRSLGRHNVEVVEAGPVLGCPEKGPYDAIVVTAASPRLQKSLLDQMKLGGRLVAPVGGLKEQELVRALKTSEGISISYLWPCRFVPLIGPEAWPEGMAGAADEA
ncbi:MAG: protein-L-isoaspartate(D-aspartate) O-methyltransferase [SAR202 cluster bacterium]|nr:protein-L-isoaspartate(D-aspartate) O-methyltransferase [SAR202 cluster bacterium]